MSQWLYLGDDDEAKQTTKLTREQKMHDAQLDACTVLLRYTPGEHDASLCDCLLLWATFSKEFERDRTNRLLPTNTSAAMKYMTSDVQHITRTITAYGELLEKLKSAAHRLSGHIIKALKDKLENAEEIHELQKSIDAEDELKMFHVLIDLESLDVPLWHAHMLQLIGANTHPEFAIWHLFRRQLEFAVSRKCAIRQALNDQALMAELHDQKHAVKAPITMSRVFDDDEYDEYKRDRHKMGATVIDSAHHTHPTRQKQLTSSLLRPHWNPIGAFKQMKALLKDVDRVHAGPEAHGLHEICAIYNTTGSCPHGTPGGYCQLPATAQNPHPKRFGHFCRCGTGPVHPLIQCPHFQEGKRRTALDRANGIVNKPPPPAKKSKSKRGRGRGRGRGNQQQRQWRWRKDYGANHQGPQYYIDDYGANDQGVQYHSNSHSGSYRGGYGGGGPNRGSYGGYGRGGYGRGDYGRGGYGRGGYDRDYGDRYDHRSGAYYDRPREHSDERRDDRERYEDRRRRRSQDVRSHSRARESKKRSKKDRKRDRD